MAGDWIKFEHVTPDKPEVVKLSSVLGVDQDAVVGKLARLWIWADQNSIDGNDVSVTDSFIDRITFCSGFAIALRNVGWLTGKNGCLTLPNFDRHNGKSSKNRATTNRRVSKHRKDRNDNVTVEALQKPLPEKRREEYILDSNSTGLPREQDLIDYLNAEVKAGRIQMLRQDAENAARIFFAEAQGRGWVDSKGIPIKDWKSAFRAWALRYASNLSKPVQSRKSTPRKNKNDDLDIPIL